ncbi:hypothetical protein [Novosphingobium soli]|uniref:Uncharacterized protein n=1 Tax=Novosphingobium soli TaxID=574956 RepID=A0ABV6D0Y4_9SPHN
MSITTFAPARPARPHLRAPFAAALLAMALAACTGGGGSVASAPSPGKRIKGVPTVRQPARTAPREAQVQMAPGLEGVVGASQGQLVQQFGAPRLDVWEGDARKLQFTGSACVLDIFLYPSASAREPHATYVEARRASDGQDVDRAACVAALRRR